MKIKSTVWLGGIALLGALSAALVVFAQTPSAGKGETALKQAAADNKSLYLLVHRDWNAQTQAAAQVVKAVAEKYPAKATWASVNITDPSEKAVVDKFQVSRAPTPMILVVHPNGATTGVFVQKVEEAKLVESLVSPKKAECMKALQQNQLVLLCASPSAQQDVPQGVNELKADPHFAQRTQVLKIQLNDPSESSFFQEMEVDPKSSAPVTVFLAPPGVLVGKFPVTATKDELAAALAAAGKCCNDPNCKHNHK